MPDRMRRASDASRHDKVALALAGIAALVASLSLLGWVFEVPALASFGANYAPAWPLTTAGYLLLSFAMVLAVLGRRGAAVAAVAVLILVAIVAVESGLGSGRVLTACSFPNRSRARSPPIPAVQDPIRSYPSCRSRPPY